MRVNHSDTTVAINSSSMATEQVDGRVSKVLIINSDADSGLAALLGNLEAIVSADIPGLTLAGNQREAVLDLRKAAYGY